MLGAMLPTEIWALIFEYAIHDTCHVCRRKIFCYEDRYAVWKFNFCSQICNFHI